VIRVFVSLVAALVLSATAVAGHEGHPHKAMGVVSMIHDTHLEVTDVKDQKKTFTLDAKTKIWRGRTALRPADIKVGERVVVTYVQSKDKTGQVTETVKMVQLGVTPTATKNGGR
jgi:hypothetical protein